MTKKDYILLAGLIRETQVAHENKAAECSALFTFQKRLCAELVKDNPRFDADRFNRVCLVEKKADAA